MISEYSVRSYTTNISFIINLMNWAHVCTSSHSTVGYDTSHNYKRNLLWVSHRANLTYNICTSRNYAHKSMNCAYQFKFLSVCATENLRDYTYLSRCCGSE